MEALLIAVFACVGLLVLLGRACFVAGRVAGYAKGYDSGWSDSRTTYRKDQNGHSRGNA